MVCSAQKVKVAVKSAKISESSHVTNSILKNASKWLVYASTDTFDGLAFLFAQQMQVECESKRTVRQERRFHRNQYHTSVSILVRQVDP